MAYHYGRRNDRKMILSAIVIGVSIGLLAGFFLFYSPVQTQIVKQYVYEQSNDTYSSAEIGLAAVDQSGNGIVTPLVVEVKPGDGKILTNIEKLLFWVDTQQSMQTATQVASNFTGIDVSKYDLIYTVRSNSTLVGGPSAGGALTAATIAALKGKSIRPDVMMTGTINADGTIGEVGGVLEKATAAKAMGMKKFLVPAGQGNQTYYTPQESCVQRANFQFCTTKYQQVTVNIGQQVGIDVIEVGSIGDAMQYLIA